MAENYPKGCYSHSSATRRLVCPKKKTVLEIKVTQLTKLFDIQFQHGYEQEFDCIKFSLPYLHRLAAHFLFLLLFKGVSTAL